jgi:hypothetical protein
MPVIQRQEILDLLANSAPSPCVNEPTITCPGSECVVSAAEYLLDNV